MISSLLGSVKAHSTGRYVQDAAGGEDVMRRRLAQQPALQRARDGAQREPAC